MPLAKTRTEISDEIWPFEDWIKQANVQFGMTPKMFWETGFRDWRRLTALTLKPALGRVDFEDMLRAFPDEDLDDDG